MVAASSMAQRVGADRSREAARAVPSCVWSCVRAGVPNARPDGVDGGARTAGAQTRHVSKRPPTALPAATCVPCAAPSSCADDEYTVLKSAIDRVPARCVVHEAIAQIGAFSTNGDRRTWHGACAAPSRCDLAFLPFYTKTSCARAAARATASAERRHAPPARAPDRIPARSRAPKDEPSSRRTQIRNPPRPRLILSAGLHEISRSLGSCTTPCRLALAPPRAAPPPRRRRRRTPCARGRGRRGAGRGRGRAAAVAFSCSSARSSFWRCARLVEVYPASATPSNETLGRGAGCAAAARTPTRRSRACAPGGCPR